MFPDLTRDDVFRLETRRMWLRWPRASDAGAVQAIASRKEVALQTSAIPHPYPPQGADAYILAARAHNTSGAALNLGLTLRTGTRDFIGFVSAEIRPRNRAYLGYALHPDYWGQNYTTEAVQAMIDTLFSVTPTVEIGAKVRVANPASKRVLEKCGFTHSGIGMSPSAALGGSQPVDTFTLDQKVWASLKGWRMPHISAASAKAELNP